MFLQTQLKTLFAYHFDVVLRLLSSAAQLKDADYHERTGYGHGSVHELLFHLLVTDLRWRTGLETGQRMPVYHPQDSPDIQENATITSSSGEVGSIPPWRILHHLVLHGMQHAAELAEILTRKGQSPGNIDFIFFVEP